MIGIGDQDLSFCTHVDHREVLEQLAANGTSSDDKGLELFDFLCSLSAYNNLEVSELLSFWNVALLKVSLDFWQFGHHFVEVEGKELTYRHVFVGDCFDGLLSDEAAKVSADCGKFGLADH